MSLAVRLKLSLMMFLQYATWGAWLVPLGAYLGGGLKLEGPQIGWCYATLPIAAMISPFFVGMIADRFFATERLLGVLHILGGLLLAYIAGLLPGTQPVQSFGQLFPFLFLYALTFMPTLSLTNTLAFRQMVNPSREFPGIRVLGTIGWIVAGTIVGKLRHATTGEWSLGEARSVVNGITFASIETTQYPMCLAAGLAMCLGIFCFFLPHTPPQATGRISLREILGLDALQLMADRSFLIFVLGSFLICIPLQFYYTFTNQFLNAVGVPDPAFKMTFGQWSEIFFMLVMPWFFRSLGVKWMLIVGMLSWASRYFLFAWGGASSEVWWMLYLGLVLHGICYDFFFVTGQIYVDQRAPAAMRGAAQGFIAFVTLGAGGAVGTVLCGYVLDFFRLSKATEVPVYNWKSFWIVPAIGALLVMLIFAALFREPRNSAGEGTSSPGSGAA